MRASTAAFRVLPRQIGSPSLKTHHEALPVVGSRLLEAVAISSGVKPACSKASSSLALLANPWPMPALPANGHVAPPSCMSQSAPSKRIFIAASSSLSQFVCNPMDVHLSSWSHPWSRL